MGDLTDHSRRLLKTATAVAGAALAGVGAFLPWVKNPTNLLFYPGGAGAGVELVSGIAVAVLAGVTLGTVVFDSTDFYVRWRAFIVAASGVAISALVTWTTYGWITSDLTVLAIGSYLALVGGLLVFASGVLRLRSPPVTGNPPDETIA